MVMSTGGVILVMKQARIVEAFREGQATSWQKAATPASIGVAERGAFQGLCRRAVLRPAGPGTWYLDEPSWDALRSSRRRTSVLLIAAFALGIAMRSLI
jgi:hypothetical protein